jgi:hypothetical protein
VKTIYRPEFQVGKEVMQMKREAERENNFQVRRIFFSAGVDVMITIFCDFRQFSAKKGVFITNQCYDQFCS